MVVTVYNSRDIVDTEMSCEIFSHFLFAFIIQRESKMSFLRTFVALTSISLAVANSIEVVHTGKLCSVGDCESGSTIGAEIRGVTNFNALTDAQISTIRQALVKYKVIYFLGAGNLLTPETQLYFANRFGSVYPTISKVPEYVTKGVHQSTHSVRTDLHNRANAGAENSINTMVEANKPKNKSWKGKQMPEEVARLVREPGDPFAFGEGLHADVTFYSEPPFFTFLVGRELPGDLDDTHFIDVTKAYETLDKNTRREITGLNALHKDSAGLEYNHPTVRTHPESKENAIYVNSHFTHTINGYNKEESEEILGKVFDHIENQPIFKFKWTCDVEKCGTKCPSCMHAVIWDNRQLQHTATSDWAYNPKFNKRRRELHRVTISGDEKPYYRKFNIKDGIECSM